MCNLSTVSILTRSPTLTIVAPRRTFLGTGPNVTAAMSNRDPRPCRGSLLGPRSRIANMENLQRAGQVWVFANRA